MTAENGIGVADFERTRYCHSVTLGIDRRPMRLPMVPRCYRKYSGVEVLCIDKVLVYTKRQWLTYPFYDAAMAKDPQL